MTLVIASSAAGRLKPSNGPAMVSGAAISNEIPEPPMMVNQKLVISGAAIYSMMTICRIERPRLTRAMKIAISGP
jgi:hypothetical protein